MNNNIEELYKKKYLKYKAKYLNLQRGGIYYNNQNVIFPINITKVGSIVSKRPEVLQIFGNSNLNNPLFIALDYQGNVVVADDKNNCLKVFDCNTGDLLRTIGSFGSQVGQFKSPSGVAFDGNGNIIVADKINHRVQVFKWFLLGWDGSAR